MRIAAWNASATGLTPKNRATTAVRMSPDSRDSAMPAATNVELREALLSSSTSGRDATV